ncbi:MAG: pyruvate formate lyase family protein, partial [Thermodesulfobacteriota bacterium]|nr:pyruvate formate lyase family protein [Thermodesulfobacteriota bacterium]
MSTEELNTKEIEKLEEEQKWWWLAEKKRSARLDHLRKAVWAKGPKGLMYLPGIKVDLERAELYTEAWKENESDPTTVRRAKAIAHVLDHNTIFIQDHSQIVGYISGLPHELHWAPERAFVGNEEIYNDRTVVPEPEEDSLRRIRAINDYWGPRTELTQVLWKLPPEDVMKLA